KALLRILVQRIIVARPTPNAFEAKVVWLDCALTPLMVHPPILRQSDVGNYDQFVQQILTPAPKVIRAPGLLDARPKRFIGSPVYLRHCVDSVGNPSRPQPDFPRRTVENPALN